MYFVCRLLTGESLADMPNAENVRRLGLTVTGGDDDDVVEECVCVC